MSTTYNGNAANVSEGQAPSITIPVDTDAANAASVNTAFQKLCDFIALLQSKAALTDASNSFSAAQTLSALLTLTSNVSLTAAVAQSILKTAAGGLALGTGASGGDLSLQAGGATLLKLLAAGSMDAQGKTLTNLAAPSAASDAARKDMGGALLNNLGTPASLGDAATKGYVDGGSPRTAKAWGRLTMGASGAVTIVKGQNIGSASWSGNSLTVNLTTANVDGYGAIFCALETISYIVAPGGWFNGSSFLINKGSAGGTAQNFAQYDNVDVMVFD